MSDPASVASRSQPRQWADNAVRLIEADSRRSADTHLLRYPLPTKWCDGVDVQL
ncbi:MAG: cysteine synthase, partial [Mycobacterium sp.]|nr:cysteine synthase [Mycobacterium sp.]